MQLRPPVLSIIGFAMIGLFSFALLCIAMLWRPETLTAESERGLALALAHMTTLGWITSLLFAGTYLVSPVLAGSPLWSRRLPAFHLACHLPGLGLLIGGLGLLNYQLASVGAGLLLLGFSLLVWNVYMTQSQRSLWTPANLAFHSAMFWLIITGAAAMLMLYGRVTGALTMNAESLLALHAHYGLFGFLAQILLAVSLRVVPEMINPGSNADAGGRLTWIGWGLLNSGLFMLLPLIEIGWIWPLFAAGAMMALGVAAFAVHLVWLLWDNRRRVSWPELTYITGIVLLVVIVTQALVSYPSVAGGTAEQMREWMRLYISLTLLGPFAFAILGVGQRLIPRLVWQLRVEPWTAIGTLPGPRSLVRPSAGGPVYFSMLLAWGYLAFGQWTADPEGIRFGAMLMLIAAFWFLVGIRPAIHRFVLGVTPDDLQQATKKKSFQTEMKDDEPAARSLPAGNPEPLTVG